MESEINFKIRFKWNLINKGFWDLNDGGKKKREIKKKKGTKIENYSHIIREEKLIL